MGNKVYQPPKFANLIKGSYTGTRGEGLKHYSEQGQERDWCKMCITSIVQGKVLSYSRKFYSKAICFACQEKIRNGEL